MNEMKAFSENGKNYLNNKEDIYEYIKLSAPIYFSITFNTEEVTSFFKEAAFILSAENFNGILLFDLENVKKITADAVMYMNALAINHLSNRSVKRIMLRFPKNKKCKTFLKQCGLTNYLSNKKNSLKETDKYYTITGGHKADVDRVREIGLFTLEKLKLEKKDLDFITSSFIELMNNTEQHAYDRNTDKLWYVFIEDTKKSLKYTFLDTGKGIPETMRKSFRDNIEDLLPIIEEDHSYFIFEALKGDIPRSSTADLYRNTGLPEIYKHYKEGKLSKLKIISCRGVCEFFDSDRLHPHLVNLNSNFCGTLFTWEVKKTQ